MKYIYAIVQIIALLAIQYIGSNSVGISEGTSLVGMRAVDYRVSTRSSALVLPSIIGSTFAVGDDKSEKPFGLHYDPDENSWILFATVTQIKKTSIYGRPGEIAQIEYSMDGKALRGGWIAVRIDEYSFVDGGGRSISIDMGQEVQLKISGEYVSLSGVDWDKCPKGNIYCMNASFVEGGFPKSEDYLGLRLCPSNTIIHAGSIPEDWINGILAWRVKY